MAKKKRRVSSEQTNKPANNQTNQPTKRVSRREEQRQAAAQTKRMGQLRTAGIIAVVVAVFAGIAIYRQATAPAADPLADIRQSTGDNDIASTLSDTELEEALGISLANIKGNVNAPVSIVEYADFGCPACRAWHNAGALEQIQEQFGDQVSFTFRHYPVITRESPKAAEAAQCAADQDAFWAYHDYIYERVNTPLTNDKLIAAAEQLGLNSATFITCLESGEKQQYVGNDTVAAQTAGARGTPTFLINGEVVSSNPADMIANISQILGE